MAHTSPNDAARPPKDDRGEAPSPEQGNLFDFDSPAPKSPRAANHPTRHNRDKKPSAMPFKPTDAPRPYVPCHHTYAEYLKWFNGMHSLALYWFNKQNVKE